MAEDENDLERFMRFSRAIAHDLPSDDGELLIHLFLDKKNHDTAKLFIDIATWLMNLDFSEEDTLSILQASRTIAAEIVFSIEKITTNQIKN